MKRLFNIMGCLTAFAGIVAGVASCTPTYDHRGGQFTPDEGPGRDAGGGGKTGNVIKLEYGYADYWGDFYQTGDTDNYLVYLYAGDTDEDGYFKGKGIILTLDMLLPMGSNLSLYTHEYKISDGGEPYTFIPTYTSKESEYEGSTLYIQNSADNYGTYKITGGVVDITKKGVTGNYVINASILVGQQTYEFQFEGYLDIQDMTEYNPGEDEPQVRPAFPGPEGSDWYAWAQYYGAGGVSYDKYTLYLSKGGYAENGYDFVTSGSEIAVTLLTDKSDGKTIPHVDGGYKAMDNVSSKYAPGYFLKSSFVDGEYRDSWLYRQYSAISNNDYALDGITDGNVDISHIGDEYSICIKFSTVADNYEVSYTGPIEFIDESHPAQSAYLKSAKNRSASGRAAMQQKREVHRNIVARQQ